MIYVHNKFNSFTIVNEMSSQPQLPSLLRGGTLIQNPVDSFKGSPTVLITGFRVLY